MKTLTVGDLHGQADWKVINPDGYDKIIFVGDYLDSFFVNNEDMGQNLLDLIEFKKKYQDKVILLLGNHDMQYLYHDTYKYRCSGYRPEYALVFNEILRKNTSLFQAAYQIENILWTHGGVSSKWAEECLYEDDVYKYGEAINFMFQRKSSRDLLMKVGRRRGGVDFFGGPLWADFGEIESFPVDGLIQIVGHTVTHELIILEGVGYELINVDTLQTSKEMYEREIEFINDEIS